MFVSIIFCKESINGEVIFMFMTKMWLFLPFSVYISLVLAVQSSFESLNFLQVCCQSSNLQFPLSCNHPPTPQENIWNFFPFCLPCYFADFWSGRRHLQKVYTLNGPGNYNFSSNFFNLNTEKGEIITFFVMNMNITSPCILSWQKIMLTNIIYVYN